MSYFLDNKADAYSAAPFWGNGPAPGAFYHFPGTATNNNSNGKQFSQSPVTTTTSVLGMHFNNGVIIAGDIAAYYGSMARYRDIQRVVKINDNIMLGAGGDFADFQHVKNLIDQKIRDERCIDDGFLLKPKALYTWLTRIMYKKRSNFDPLWNNLVIAGFEDDKPFLGTVDKLGTAYSDPIICTGFGAHIATPMLRSLKDSNPNISEKEATDAIYKCMEVLYYRDARSFPKYQIGIITKERGIEIKGPIEVKPNWEIAPLIQGYL